MPTSTIPSRVLYIGIPAYNEATTIGVLLWRLRSVLSEVSREYEVVVYDDASTDETASTLAPYSRVLPLTVLRGAQRVGYAGAVDALARHVAKTTRYPRRDALLLLQGDFTDPPALVPEFLRRFEGGADLIIGERTTPGDAPPAIRRLWQASRWVLRPFVGITDVRDLTASYRLVRIAVLRDLIKASGDAPVAVGEGWSANADFLLRAAPFARRVETIPVTPTFGVRVRESRRTAWPDALALAKWGWGRRGQRVAVKVIARTVDAVPEAEEVADVPERSAPSERRERPDRSERRPRREAAERPEREKATRPDREKGARPGSDRERAPRPERGPSADAASAEQKSRPERAPREQPTAEAASIAPAGEQSELETGAAETTRKPRKRRKRGARRERVAGADGEMNGADEVADDGIGGVTLSAEDAEGSPEVSGEGETSEPGEEGAARSRRKRSRRGRRRKGEPRANGAENADGSTDHAGDESREAGDAGEEGARSEDAGNAGDEDAVTGDSGGSRRRRSRRGRRGGSRRRAEGDAGSPEGSAGSHEAGGSDEPGAA